MAKVLDPNIVTEKDGSPVYEETSDGYTITRTFDVRIFDPIDAKSYLPDYGELYETASGTVMLAQVTDIKTEPAKTGGRTADPLTLGTVTYTFDKGGGEGGNRQRDSWSTTLMSQTGHITHVKDPSKQKIYPPAGGGEDPSTAIGVNGDKIEGVDIFVGAAEIEVTKFWTHEDITPELMRTWHNAEATTNDAPFTVGKIEAQIGELLFMGVTVSRTGGERAKTVAKYVFEPNRTGPDALEFELIDGTKVNVEKGGHEYLWTGPGRALAGAPGSASSKTKAGIASIHVATVYEASNFDALQMDIEED
jgi:hypothetical protein